MPNHMWHGYVEKCAVLFTCMLKNAIWSLEEKMSLAQCADGNPDRSLIDGWSSALRDHWLRNYLCVRLFYSDGLQSCCVCGEGGACREGNRWFITLVPKS